MFLAHFFADWVVQSVETGREKSNNFLVLLYHIFQIFMVTFIAGSILLGPELSAKLALLNALSHLVIDGFIWKFYKIIVLIRNWGTDIDKLKKEYKYWLDPVFGWTLGIDQCLHFIFIYLIYSPYLES